MVSKSKQQGHTNQDTPTVPAGEKVICNIEVKKQCTKRWDELTPVSGEMKQKFCDSCGQNVYLCESREELEFHLSEKRCTATNIEQLNVEGENTIYSLSNLTVGMLGVAKYEVGDPEAKND